jgi:hypothetical protein
MCKCDGVHAASCPTENCKDCPWFYESTVCDSGPEILCAESLRGRPDRVEEVLSYEKK